MIAVIPSERSIAHTKLEKIQLDWINGTANSIRPGLNISGFALFLRSSVFTKLSFDSTLGYGEDEDFLFRLKTIYTNPNNVTRSTDSIISVHCSHTLKELKSQYSWYGRTFKTFLHKKYLVSNAKLC